MTLDGDAVEIVGVMPPGVDFPRGAEFWVPGRADPRERHAAEHQRLSTPSACSTSSGGCGRAFDVAASRGEVDATEARLDRANPGRLKWGTTAVVTPFVDYVFGPVRPALRVLWAAVARAAAHRLRERLGPDADRGSARRRHEHSIRLALGATRRAIARSWLAEMLLVAAAGGALGLAVAHWIARAIAALAPDDLPRACRHRRERAGRALHVCGRHRGGADHVSGAAPACGPRDA